MKKHNNHSHYWVHGGELFESYDTIRGRRWRVIKEVPGKKNCDRCDENGDPI